MTTYHDHPQYVALHKACEADFFNDLPRLVLADWLDEWDGGNRKGAEFYAGFLRRFVERRRSYRPRPPLPHTLR